MCPMSCEDNGESVVSWEPRAGNLWDRVNTGVRGCWCIKEDEDPGWSLTLAGWSVSELAKHSIGGVLS